jgi:hypothetical protein
VEAEGWNELERRVMRRLSTERKMQIVKNEIDVKFTVREAQSLLMVLRRVNVLAKPITMQGIPDGSMGDVRDLQMELERALLMDKNVGA